MKRFRLIDNLTGWLVFAVAAFTYCSTVEPTASFWDCPEFITTAYKLEVGHPPGAPFFMLMGNLFSHFTSDVTKVALMVNIMNALMSAGCILFLFWSITHLVRKLIPATTAGSVAAIEFSGIVGALAYCWSDTFWFSAVEGEVYAFSSLFTAVVFWLMLKWEEHADEPQSDRWLVFIAFLTGISVGVHLLNLLCVPALVLIFYFKRASNPTWQGTLLSLCLSGVLVALVLYGIVPGIVKVGGWFELLFVNTLHFSFNTGLCIYILLLVSCVVWSLWETHVNRNRNRMIASFLLSFGMLGIPFYGYGIVSIVIGVLVLGLLAGLLVMKRNDVHVVTARLLNTAMACMFMIIVGYSSYAVIVIRSSANTPMDQNSPEDIFTLGSYLSREQYGDRPLFYGQAFSSDYVWEEQGNGYYKPKVEEGAPIYQRVEKHSIDEPDSYEVISHHQDIKYAQNMLFPRMYSNRQDPGANHVQFYKTWNGGIKGRKVKAEFPGQPYIIMPTQGDNISFFLTYQCGFMYWRYFLWNFAGRQNDIQGNGEIEHGNWLSGIPFIDNARLGDQSKLPDELKANKGHNVFYCLPLLLGLIGLFWQVSKGRKGGQQFWVTFFLFFMTGLAIVVYLNQTPLQPRERDYAYAGSFYAFAIWIGLGVAALCDWLAMAIRRHNLWANLAIGVLCTFVPLQMVSQTWDDHDRSGRYTCRDFGLNYLNSLDEKGNPVIFTNGDNDTFPLWYAQETEEQRTDARVCNLSYLQTDWYIDQMRRPAYDSPSLPITWSRLQYVNGTREGISVKPKVLPALEAIMAEDQAALQDLLEDQETYDIVKKVLESRKAYMLLSGNPYELANIIDRWVLDDDLKIIPTDHPIVTVDREAVLRSGMMIAADSIPEVMELSLEGRRTVYKSEMMMLEMLARANWERPLYVAITVGESNYGSLGKYFVQEGLANRITPFNTQQNGRRMDTERIYNNLMHKFRYGGLDQEGLYLDETVLRMCWTHRRLFIMLAQQLLAEGDSKRALEVLEKADKEIPAYNVPYGYESRSELMAQVYARCGKQEKAQEILDSMTEKSMQYLSFYSQLNDKLMMVCSGEINAHFSMALMCCQYANSLFDNDYCESTYKPRYDQLDGFFQHFVGHGIQIDF